MSKQNSLNKTNNFEKVLKNIKYLFILLLFWLSHTSTLFAQAAIFHVNVGVNYLNKNQFVEAYQEFNKALEKDPNCAEAHYYLGKVYKSQGATQDAVFEFQTALRIKPDYAEAKRELSALNVSPNSTAYSQNNAQQAQSQRNTYTERPRKDEPITITSVSPDEVSSNPKKYIGKYIEWSGRVELVYKTKRDLMIMVNTKLSVSAKNNMDYCFVVVYPEVRDDESSQIPVSSTLSVKGKIAEVHKIYYDDTPSSRKQPIIKPIQLEVSDSNYSTPINISF